MVYNGAMGNNKAEIYKLDEMKELHRSTHKGKSKASFYKSVRKMVDSGAIIRIERGRYSSSPRKQAFEAYCDYDDSRRLKSFLTARYGGDFEFIIYETTLLNQFLNHLLAKAMIVVEVPRAYAEDVFWGIKDSGQFESVLLCPTSDELYRYGEAMTIVVRPYVSKAPINLQEHATTLEKLLVDIVCDPFLNSLYEGAEVPAMVNGIVNDYALRYRAVSSYAKRRSAYEDLLAYLDEDKKELFR